MGTRLLTRLSALTIDDPDGTPGNPLPSARRIKDWKRILAAHHRDLSVLRNEAEDLPLDLLSSELRLLSLPSLDHLVDADGVVGRAKLQAGELHKRESECLHEIGEPAARYIDWAEAHPRRAALFERGHRYIGLVPGSIVEADKQIRDGRAKAKQHQQAAAILIEQLPGFRRQLRDTLARMILPSARLIRDIERIRSRRQAETDNPAFHYATRPGGRVALFDHTRRTHQREQQAADQTAWMRARQTVDRLRTACLLHREERLPRVGQAFGSLLSHESIIFDDILIEALATNQAQCFAYEAMLEPYRDIIDHTRIAPLTPGLGQTSDTES